MPVPRPLLLLLALLLAAALAPTATTAGAQDATPQAERGATSDDGFTAAGDPLVGTAVPYQDEEGEEIGLATVLEVTDPFTDFSEGFTPDELTRYLAVEISVAGTGQQLEANPFDFSLQTVDGFLFSNTSASRDVTSSSTPDLESITVDIDDEITGLVFFEIPATAEPARILWQPESGRLLVLADLR